MSYRFTTTIPHDSWYVKIWVETGIVGLILYLGFLFISIAHGAWIIMFRIKNKELKGLLTGLVAFTGLALVLKGIYFDAEISNNNNNKIIQNI